MRDNWTDDLIYWYGTAVCVLIVSFAVLVIISCLFN